MPSVSSFSTGDSVFQYSDSTISAAFEQNPQIKLPLKVAVYDVGYESLSITDTLEELESIQSITHISPGLVEGSRYYERIANPWYHRRISPPKTRPMQLRTLAAQAHCDIILFVGTHHVVYGDTNGLAWFYLPLIPMFFVKGNQIEVNSFVDMYLIDVRNGFIYNSYRTQATSRDKFVKINNEKDVDRLKQKNIQSLTNELLQEINRVLNRDDFQLSQSQ